MADVIIVFILCVFIVISEGIQRILPSAGQTVLSQIFHDLSIVLRCIVVLLQ